MAAGSTSAAVVVVVCSEGTGSGDTDVVDAAAEVEVLSSPPVTGGRASPDGWYREATLNPTRESSTAATPTPANSRQSVLVLLDGSVMTGVQ